jgi:acyl-CoA hydrolase
MPQELTAEQAAALLETTDTLGMPLGPGQPPALLRALGQREDWTDLRVYGALLAVLTELFSRTGVRYLSGFFGPLERALRTAGFNVDFTPADFRRFGPLLEARAPRVMTTVATSPDADGWCSLSLHAGGTIGELRRAGADPRPAARRRGIRLVSADFRARRASPRAARRRDRRPGALDRRTARAAGR